MKLTQEQLDKVLELQREYLTQYPQLRAGQAFFNALYTLYPIVADEIRGTDYDPFYQNVRIDNCIKYITGETIEITDVYSEIHREICQELNIKTDLLMSETINRVSALFAEISALRMAQGLSHFDMAIAIGKTEDYIRQIFSKSTEELTIFDLMELAKSVGYTIELKTKKYPSYEYLRKI